MCVCVCVCVCVLTGDHDEGEHAGERGDVEFDAVQGATELHDGVDPLAEAGQTLQPVQHEAVAEDDPLVVSLRPEKHEAHIWSVLE